MARTGSLITTGQDMRRVLDLLDTSEPRRAVRSCFAAAVREARGLGGRDPSTGIRPSDNDHDMTWAGALVWFVFLEQVGQCFRPVSAAGTGQHIENALVWFGGVDRADAAEVALLRHRFAHDYTLAPADGPRRWGLNDGPELVVRSATAPAVSLVALAETAERVLRRLRVEVLAGRVEVHHPGGLDRVVERFTMGFGSR